MALDILTQDIIIDETTGLQNDDVDPSVALHSTNTRLQYLLGRVGGRLQGQLRAGHGERQGKTIISVVLAQNLAGTLFSTTVGVNSVVIGVIGTSDPNPAAEPAETGTLAFQPASSRPSRPVRLNDITPPQLCQLRRPRPRSLTSWMPAVEAFIQTGDRTAVPPRQAILSETMKALRER